MKLLRTCQEPRIDDWVSSCDSDELTCSHILEAMTGHEPDSAFDRPLVRHPIGPTAHWSDSPLFRQPTGPTARWSDSPLV